MSIRRTILAFWCLSLAGGVVLAQETYSINYFRRFVIDGGYITWLVLIPLSIATSALIIEHARKIRAGRLLPRSQYDRFRALAAQGDMAGTWKAVSQADSFIARVLQRGLAELAGSYEAAEYAVIEAAEEQATRLLRKIEFLSIIGNVAPMIGLFGTVYGIILAFNKLVEVVRQGGVTQPDQLAEGISIALVTTFWGLIVAIPALAMYGLFRNRIDDLTAQAANLALDLIRNIRPELRAALRDAAAPQARSQE